MKKEDNKCPNCGSLLKSFETTCPYCRTEIRNINCSETLKKFSIGLKELQSLRTTNENEKTQNYEQIAEYIKNYPIPNSKEDLIEFMILISSNIDLNIEDEDKLIVQKAWKNKLEQVYEKAKLSIKSQKDLKYISDIYTDINNKIKNKKKKELILLVSIFGSLLFLMGILTNPIITLTISLVLIILFLFLYIKFLSTNTSKTDIFLNKKYNSIVNLFKEKPQFKYLSIGILMLILSIGIYLGLNPDAIHPPGYKVSIHIDFENNLFLNKYNIILHSDKKEQTLYHGQNKDIILYLKEGNHTLKFENYDNKGIFKQIEINIDSDTEIGYKIKCYSDKIDVTELYFNKIEK